MRSIIQKRVFMGIALAGLMVSPVLLNAAPAPRSARPFLGLAAEAAGGNADGITVHSVTADGPAGKAGLKSSDRIVMVDGKKVTTFDELKKLVAEHKPGDKVALKVLRDGKEESVTVTLGEAPQLKDHAAAPNGKPHSYLGVQAQALTMEFKEHLGVKADKGALVTRVMPESPAAKAGLEEEDVITHVGDVAVTSPAGLRDAVQKAGIGKELTLKLARGAKTMDLKVKLQEAPAGFAAAPHFGMPERFNMPEDLKDFSEHLRPFFKGNEKYPSLEKKLQELENRIHELEKKATR